MRVKTVGQALTKGFSQFRPLITNTHGNLDLVGTSTWELVVNFEFDCLLCRDASRLASLRVKRGHRRKNTKANQ